MRAAVLHEIGGTPRVEDFREPSGDGEVVAILAAGLNPVDVTIASGRMPARRPEPPAVCGLEGVARRSGGERVYVYGVPPFGTFAERALADPSTLFPVPDDVDDGTAVCLGVSGLAAWLPLAWRARVRDGETVLVLGATGVAGLIAVQAAKLLGAGRVVAAGRNPELLERARSLGADSVLKLDEVSGDLVEAIRSACEGPVDVTIDYLWGEPGAAATLAAGPGARHVQVGNSAGQESTIRSAPWRIAQLDIQGYSTFTVAPDEVRSAYAALAEHAGAGRIVAAAEEVPLDDFASAWERQTAGPGAKLVLRP
jgi:NADPH2:quinone reductase